MPLGKYPEEEVGRQPAQHSGEKTLAASPEYKHPEGHKRQQHAAAAKSHQGHGPRSQVDHRCQGDDDSSSNWHSDPDQRVLEAPLETRTAAGGRAGCRFLLPPPGRQARRVIAPGIRVGTLGIRQGTVSGTWVVS